MKKTILSVVMGAALFLAPSLGAENAVLVDLSRTSLAERNYKVAHTAREERCLTEAIYYEASNQSQIGKEAVAIVVMNRVGARHRPKTICGVVTQAHIIRDRKVCQFSFWCETKRKPEKEAWKESSEIAHRVLQSYWKRDILTQYSEASYYHADYVHPKWRKSKVFVGKIENHLFYREP